MSYRRLDPTHIIATAERLAQRIAERFPNSGLGKVAADLVLLSRDIASDAERAHQPIAWLRWTIGLTFLAGALLFAFVGTFISFDQLQTETLDNVQGIESLINTLLLGGVGIYSLIQLEERLKRKSVLRGLHQIRSLVHVIDMHQLTKDPAALSQDFKPTPSSPRRVMSPADLSRYLDYCTEMLSITGKLAALYAQAVNDSDVVDAVNDVEELGSNLSRKIWQKIMLLQNTGLK